MHLSQHPTCPCWHLLSICVTLKIAFHPLYLRYPSWNKADTLAALVIYDMDWASRVFTCTPLLSVSCGTNIWGNCAWGQVVPWPQPFSVSFLISQSFFRCCCVLGVACYGIECLCLWWEVSLVGWSWLRSFLQMLSLSLWMLLFRERSIFHFEISSGTYIIFMTVVTQAEKVPEVCLTRIAWTEIEKAGWHT